MNDVVHVRDLVKTYGGVPAVDGIGFDVAIGETFGLLGANGAGKTTTLECLLGVSRPDAGSVTILGLDPRTRRKELFQRVGVQFQEARYQDKITVDELCRATRALYRPGEAARAIQPDRGAQASRRVAVGRPAPAPVRGAGAHPAS